MNKKEITKTHTHYTHIYIYIDPHTRTYISSTKKIQCSPTTKAIACSIYTQDKVPNKQGVEKDTTLRIAKKEKYPKKLRFFSSFFHLPFSSNVKQSLLSSPSFFVQPRHPLHAFSSLLFLQGPENRSQFQKTEKPNQYVNFSYSVVQTFIS